MTKTLRKILLTFVATTIAIGAYADNYIRHEVKRGETLYGIAHKYKVSYRQIEELNPQAASGVKKGMIILVPTTDQTVQDITAETPEKQAPKSTPEANTPSATDNATKPVAVESTTTPKEETIAAVDETVSTPPIPEVYYAGQGDTFTTIADKFGLNVDTLIELNPFIDPNNIRLGAAVRLKEQAPLVVKGETSALDVIDSTIDPETVLQDTLNDLRNSDINAQIDGILNTTQTIVITLPFMTDSETFDKQAQRYGDFYRGFLIAAQEASERDGRKIEIRALDTSGSLDRLKTQLNNSLAYAPQIVIAPEDDASLAVADQFAKDNGVYVLNLFNVRDTSYVNNPYMLQANIRQQLMYDKAINFFVREYDGFTPVFLISEGKTEKMPFVEALRTRYTEMGLPTLTVNFDTHLKPSDLEILNSEDRYVFVPASGAMSEFNKFARTLSDLKNREGNIDRMALFGYPDWTAFRSDARTRLHDLEATIYSRFYYDEGDDQSKRLDDTYFDWYGTSMTESVPMQAVLGYDTANMLIDMSNTGLTVADVLRSGVRFRGLQSVFRFTNEGDGYVNDGLYIIKFLPERITDVRVL